MPAPSIEVYVNTIDSDTSPGWYQVTSSLALYWAGSLTSESNYVPVSRRIYNLWVPELWIGDLTTYGNGKKVNSYHLPTDATQRAKVLGIKLVSGILSDKIELTAYDDSDHDSTTLQVFGTPASSNTGWIKAIPTGGSFDSDQYSVPPQNWCSFNTSNSIADDTVNCLVGGSNYIRWSSVPTAGQWLYCAIAHMIGYDGLAGWQTPVICIRYKWVD